MWHFERVDDFFLPWTSYYSWKYKPGKLPEIFKCKDFSLNIKRWTDEQCILPDLVYGSQTWSLTC